MSLLPPVLVQLTTAIAVDPALRLLQGAQRLRIDAEHATALADLVRLRLEKAAVTARSIGEFPAEGDEALLTLLLLRVSLVVDGLDCVLDGLEAEAA